MIKKKLQFIILITMIDEDGIGESSIEFNNMIINYTIITTFYVDFQA